MHTPEASTCESLLQSLAQRHGEQIHEEVGIIFGGLLEREQVNVLVQKADDTILEYLLYIVRNTQEASYNAAYILVSIYQSPKTSSDLKEKIKAFKYELEEKAAKYKFIYEDLFRNI